jgi:hypothetical protein
MQKETKGLLRKKHRTLASPIQKDWQKRENDWRKNIWSDGHQEVLVATITGVAKTLTFQQWQSEWIGQIPNGQNQNRFP